MSLLLSLMTLFLLAACRSAGNLGPTPAPTPVVMATTTPAAARGEESPAEATVRAATPTRPAGVEEPAAGVIYSVPFEVRPDGFGFRNYGAGYPEGDFTIVELRAQFGDGVCARIDKDGDRCIPTAEAQQWIDDRNADMAYGHCIGFTVTSYHFIEAQIQPAMFAPDAATPFDIAREAPIMRTIAANGALYWVNSVWESEVTGTPREIIDALIALEEPVDLSIFLPGLVGGHSLLAYGLAEVAPRQYHILVYDNNFPGTEAFVEVDYEANTWRYAQGAVNPEQDAVPYEGDATTETLRFIPLSAYETATCPFCPADAEEAEEDEDFTLLSFLGQGEVLVETALGRIGQVAGAFINEIPGAQFILPRGQLSANGTPGIALPADIDLAVEFNGLERVSALGPNLSLVIDHLVPAGENNRLEVAPDAQGIDFQSGGEQSPTLNVTIRQDLTAYKVTLLGGQFADGQGITIGVASGGDGLEFRSQQARLDNTTLLIARLTDEGEAIFATTSLDVQEDGGVILDLAAWDGSGSVDLYADEDGDGSYNEQPTRLSNEPLVELLQQGDTTAAAGVIDNLAPFLGEEGLDNILETLAEQGASGREIGEILQPLQLPDDQLIHLITVYALPAPELAELLFALRLEPERLDAVIAGLDLTSEEEEALRLLLADLALFEEIRLDWAFLNTDDLTQLIALLAERNLTSEQLARLLSRLNLSESEIEHVLGGLQLSTANLVEIVEELGVDMPATATPTPTLTASQSATITATAELISVTLTVTISPTLGATGTIEAIGTPAGTPTPDPYPGELPLPTGTPASYPYPDPYPGPEPSPTGNPPPYPGGPSPTPEFRSAAYCLADDLRVRAEEITWPEETAIEIWAGEELLLSGLIGPDGDAFEVTIPGPSTWTDLRITAATEPEEVPLGTITCPIEP